MLSFLFENQDFEHVEFSANSTSAIPIEHETGTAKIIELACLLEVAARKPGNVHPERAFDDLSWQDFVTAAEAASPALAAAGRVGIGPAIWQAISQTRAKTHTNVNLGIVLLIAPLAAISPSRRLSDGIEGTLRKLSQSDAADVYRAIHLANPGGMGRVEREDVQSVEGPKGTLREVMVLAADRDLIAREYVQGFPIVLREGLPYLATFGKTFSKEWELAIIGLQMELLGRHGDSLISRKCGEHVAREASSRARQVLDSGWPDSLHSVRALQEFDQWLREDGHRRNPGTTADLIAASLFAAFREGVIPTIEPPRPH